MDPIRILVADDHALFRRGLHMVLEQEPDIDLVGEAADGSEAIRLAIELVPDVVLMDISLPSMSGLKATKLLRECCPEVKVLALTRHKDGAYLQEMLRAGASGYVLKQSSSTELLRALREIASGNSYLDPALTGKVITVFAAGAIGNSAIASVSEGQLQRSHESRRSGSSILTPNGDGPGTSGRPGMVRRSSCRLR